MKRILAMYYKKGNDNEGIYVNCYYCDEIIEKGVYIELYNKTLLIGLIFKNPEISIKDLHTGEFIYE